MNSQNPSSHIQQSLELPADRSLPPTDFGKDVIPVTPVYEFSHTRPASYLILCAACAVIVAISGPLFLKMADGEIGSDVRLHAQLAVKAFEHHTVPPHPLLHLILTGIHLIIPLTVDTAAHVIALLMLLAVITKFVLTYFLIRSWLTSSPHSPNEPSANHSPLVVLLFFLQFAGPIWSPEIGLLRFYVGKFSPSIWHNPTTIVAMPIHIFYYMCLTSLIVHGFSVQKLLLCGASIILGCLAKPSFFIAHIPAMLLYSGIKLKSRERNSILGLMGIACVVLAWQAVQFSDLGGKLSIAPLRVWKIWSRTPSVSLLMSILFPLATTVFISNVNAPLEIATILTFSFATAYAMLLTESGVSGATMERHANFFWGAHMSVYFLFLLAVYKLYLSWSTQSKPLKIALTGLLGVHIVCGVTWLIKIYAGFGYE